jgi:uncharacterized protein with PIN domain
MEQCDNPECGKNLEDGDKSTVIGYMYEEFTYCSDCKIVYDNMTS